MHADTTDTDPLNAARAVPRCPDCGAVIQYSWHPDDAPLYGSRTVAWCPACGWREAPCDWQEDYS